MEERRELGFRKRPDFAEVLAYIDEKQPLKSLVPLPNRRASIYTSSHFYLDEFPQAPEPLSEAPRPHTQLDAAVEEDFASADDGYQGRPFPRLRRPSFLRTTPVQTKPSGATVSTERRARLRRPAASAVASARRRCEARRASSLPGPPAWAGPPRTSASGTQSRR